MIKRNKMFGFISSICNAIDERLIEHGERVAYCLYKVLQYQGCKSKDEMKKWCMVALLHDIAAYRSDEIDHMLSFDDQKNSSEVAEHCVGGYFVIKGIEPISAYADALLYHHSSYKTIIESDCENKELAQLIHIIDSLDVNIANGLKDMDLWLSNQEVIEEYNPKYIHILRNIEKKDNLIKCLENQEYKKEWKNIVDSWEFSKEEIEAYLHMIVYFIDFRSEVTVTHTITTVSIAVNIGKILGYSEELIYKLYWGASLHDIGKIAIPVHILEKQGKLTDEEFDIVKKHVSICENILKDYIEDDVVNIAVRHHEKLDGSGYPYGLKYDEISQKERIVAVADIISALTMKRSYKDEFSRTKVIDILNSMKEENKLCPVIVDLAIDNYDFIMGNVDKNCRILLDYYNNGRSKFEYYMRNIYKIDKVS